ncbi:MAG: asparaginase [Solirubrobacteraceae bacterium]|nr:asparaginase [Solirubrobacteraceae bacterium]
MAKPEPRRLGIINTGGTIGGAPRHGVVRTEARDDAQIRKWASGTAFEVTHVHAPFEAMSENFLPSDWLTIARSVNDLVETGEVDAVLVLHGTDTMTYTSAACSFMLANLPVPVVITGSNRGYDLLGSDGPTNVRAAITALDRLERGVYVVFAGRRRVAAAIHVGTRVRKVQAGGTAYSTIGGSPIGAVSDGGIVTIDRPIGLPVLPPTVEDPLVAPLEVVMATSQPGLDYDVLRRGIESTSEVGGVVIVMYPSATVSLTSGRHSAVEFAAWCTENRLPVVATTTTPPLFDLDDYESTRRLKEAGAVVRTDIMPETAAVKLAWSAAVARATGLAPLPIFSEQVFGEFSTVKPPVGRV